MPGDWHPCEIQESSQLTLRSHDEFERLPAFLQVLLKLHQQPDPLAVQVPGIRKVEDQCHC